ncbi:putative sulfate exporter family transporter [Sediminivirga luteola]|nr:putative sulfate exporter family transporter [Sediminivirga luteola]
MWRTRHNVPHGTLVRVTFRTVRAIAPGLLSCLVGVLVAIAIAANVDGLPMLTAAVILGLVLGNVTGIRQYAGTVLKPGLDFAARTVMRAGIVLLGLQLSLGDVAGLGVAGIGAVIGLVILAFALIWLLGRLFRLPHDESLLIASGYSICGASAIGAMSAVTRTPAGRAAAPVALVTLCGTLSIFVLPLLAVPLGLSDPQLGWWAGAGVHDVGQVVATAGSAGTAALAVAVVVKLTRVVMLAPMTAVVSLAARRNPALLAAEARGTDASGSRPAIVPLFVLGFLAAVLLRTSGWLPEAALETAAGAQHVLLGAALVALGSQVKIGRLLTTQSRYLALGLLAWIVIGGLALLLALLLA